MNHELLSQEEYKNKFMHCEEYIKREYFEEYISRRLAEEFDMKYNEGTKHWCSGWNENKRFVVELYYPKGTHIFLRWGYNYDFIPDINRKHKLVWHRTDSSVKIHLDDSWHAHIEYTKEKGYGFMEEEFYNPRKCPKYQYEIPAYTSDIDFAVDYIKTVIDKNIPFMSEWVGRVKTIDDAIDAMIQSISEASILRVPYMQYVLAFLYAKNKNIEDAMHFMKEYYGDYEIPQILIDKLNQLADA